MKTKFNNGLDTILITSEKNSVWTQVLKYLKNINISEALRGVIALESEYIKQPYSHLD